MNRIWLRRKFQENWIEFVRVEGRGGKGIMIEAYENPDNRQFLMSVSEDLGTQRLSLITVESEEIYEDIIIKRGSDKLTAIMKLLTKLEDGESVPGVRKEEVTFDEWEITTQNPLE